MRWKSLILGCALAFAPALAASAKEPEAAAQHIVHAHPALWIAKDHDTTIYLFGTVHLLKPEIQWFEGNVRKAFDKSQDVVLEVAEEETGTQGKLMQRALDIDGPTITSRLPEASRAKYLAALESHGLAPILFERVKPWFAAITLSVLPLRNHGYDPASGADHRIKLMAKEAGKTLIGLETSDQQIGFFESLPDPLQIQMLDETLNELPQLGDTIGNMIAAWSAGEPEKLAALMNDTLEVNPELEQRLLTDRNVRWADWITARMEKPGTVFMAVGAGHLAGASSVQALLAQRGIDTTLVKRIE
jgi:uncharacterized protein YbaP (TraB family)